MLPAVNAYRSLTNAHKAKGSGYDSSTSKRYETDYDTSSSAFSGFSTSDSEFDGCEIGANICDADISTLRKYRRKLVHRISDRVVNCLDRVYAKMCAMSDEKYREVYNRLRKAVWYMGAKSDSLCGRMFGKGMNHTSIIHHPSIIDNINIYCFCPTSGKMTKLRTATDMGCEKATVYINGNSRFEGFGFSATSDLRTDGILNIRTCNKRNNLHSYKSVEHYRLTDSNKHKMGHYDDDSCDKRQDAGWALWAIIFVIIIIIIIAVIAQAVTRNYGGSSCCSGSSSYGKSSGHSGYKYA